MKNPNMRMRIAFSSSERSAESSTICCVVEVNCRRIQMSLAMLSTSCDECLLMNSTIALFVSII